MNQVTLVTIPLANVRKIQENIDAIKKAIDKKPLSLADEVLLIDTISILCGIKSSQEKA
jgi:hypothetical protein